MKQKQRVERRMTGYMSENEAWTCGAWACWHTTRADARDHARRRRGRAE